MIPMQPSLRSLEHTAGYLLAVLSPVWAFSAMLGASVANRPLSETAPAMAELHALEAELGAEYAGHAFEPLIDGMVGLAMDVVWNGIQWGLQNPNVNPDALVVVGYAGMGVGFLMVVDSMRRMAGVSLAQIRAVVPV